MMIPGDISIPALKRAEAQLKSLAAVRVLPIQARSRIPRLPRPVPPRVVARK